VVIRNGNELKLTAQVGRLDDRLLVVAGPPPAPGDLGLTVDEGSPAAARGVVVTTVTNGSLAAEAGLGPDDVIVSVQGRPVRDVDQYLALLGHRDLLTRSVQLGVRSAGGTEREVYLAPAAG
jgi:S1-C subfamily serine protease